MFIVISGPESSGKSTLSQDVCSHYGIDHIPEYARSYLEAHGPHYAYSDLLKIAKKQHKLLQIAVKQTDLIVADTDLLTIQIWSKYKYGKVDKWIVETLRDHKPDLYLLCAPDIPWEEDPIRENQNDRKELFDLYEEGIKQLEVPYIILKGGHENRTQESISAIKALLDSQAHDDNL